MKTNTDYPWLNNRKHFTLKTENSFLRILNNTLKIYKFLPLDPDNKNLWKKVLCIRLIYKYFIYKESNTQTF